MTAKENIASLVPCRERLFIDGIYALFSTQQFEKNPFCCGNFVQKQVKLLVSFVAFLSGTPMTTTNAVVLYVVLSIPSTSHNVNIELSLKEK